MRFSLADSRLDPYPMDLLCVLILVELSVGAPEIKIRFALVQYRFPSRFGVYFDIAP